MQVQVFLRRDSLRVLLSRKLNPSYSTLTLTSSQEKWHPNPIQYPMSRMAQERAQARLQCRLGW